MNKTRTLLFCLTILFGSLSYADNVVVPDGTHRSKQIGNTTYYYGRYGNMIGRSYNSGYNRYLHQNNGLTTRSFQTNSGNRYYYNFRSRYGQSK